MLGEGGDIHIFMFTKRKNNDAEHEYMNFSSPLDDLPRSLKI